MYVGVGQFLILLAFIPLIVLFHNEAIGWIYGIFNISYNVWAVIYFFVAFSAAGIAKSLLAIAIPQIAAYFMNYLLYSIMPTSFWLFLDNVLA